MCASRLGKFVLAVSLWISVAANAHAVDINGGSSWGGWTLYGASDDLGIYGSGQVTNPYDVYTTLFDYAGETESGGPAGGPGWGGFANGDRVLGIGIKMKAGEAVSGSRTLRIDLGNDSYVPASSVGGVDGKTSSTLYAHDGDYNVQNSTGFVANQLVVFTPAVNITAEAGNPYGGTRPFTSYSQTDSYQIFVNLSKVETWRANSVSAGYGVGSDPIPAFGSSLRLALNGYGNNNVVLSLSGVPVELSRFSIE